MPFGFCWHRWEYRILSGRVTKHGWRSLRDLSFLTRHCPKCGRREIDVLGPGHGWKPMRSTTTPENA
jgi:hypothetical protein